MVKKLTRIYLIFAATVFLWDRSEQQDDHITRSWQLLTTKAVGNSGKVRALEYLNWELCLPDFLPNMWRSFCWKEQEVLSGIDLSSEPGQPQTYLRNLNLPDVSLEMANFSRADVTASIFRGGEIGNSKFERVEASNANFSQSSIFSTSFSDSNLTGSDFDFSTITGSNFNGVYSYAKLVRIGYVIEDFPVCVSNIRFRNSSVSGSLFRGARIDCVDFSGASLHDVDFTDSKLGNAIFRKTRATSVNFTNALLHGALFDNFRPKDCDLSGADFEAARFENDSDFGGCRSESHNPPVNLPEPYLAQVKLD